MSDSVDTATSLRHDDQSSAFVVAALRRRVSIWRWGGLPLLAGALGIAIIFGTTIGAVPISPWHSAGILLNATHLFHIHRAWPSYDEDIILRLRLPRVLAATLVGMALGVAGAIFQGLLRNPLADPLLLGTSSGAALGATIAFLVPGLLTVAWLGFSVIAVLAFAGALAAVALVYRLATRAGQTPVVTLLLAGVALSAMLTGVQTLLVTFLPHQNLQIYSLYNWISGAITATQYPAQLGVVGALVALSLVGAQFLAPVLDAFTMGEEMTSHLGFAVERYKLLCVALAALLVALAVSMSGLVGFVGLIAPHLCRIVFGPRHRLLLPATALAGGLVVVVADLLARTLAAPTEIPLGVITALAGGPFFLSLLRFAGQRYQW
jgi:iron complex transport system permease protein